MLEVARMMKRAATCSGRSYAPRVPPWAQLDRLTGSVYCCAEGASSIRGCLDVKCPFRLSKEMIAETRSTERSHKAQPLIV
jgi:hypothetical protein